MMRSELDFDGRAVTGTVYDGDTFVLRVRLEAVRVPVPFRVAARALRAAASIGARRREPCCGVRFR